MDPEKIPEGSIVITPEQAWRETNEKFGKIDAKLDSLSRDFHSIPATVAEHAAYLTGLQKAGLPERFTELEKDVAVLKGKWMWLAGLGFAASLAVGLFGSAIANAISGG